VYFTDVTDSTYYYDPDRYLVYDIDSDLISSSQCPRVPLLVHLVMLVHLVLLVHLALSMPFSKWSQLSQDAKNIWDELPDETKASSSRLGVTLHEVLTSFFRNTNLHDISAHDYILANIHDLHPGSERDVDEARSVSFRFAK
jgi:hypothetical protein